MTILLHHALEKSAVRYGDKTAVIFSDCSYSYRWLNNASNNLAAYLQSTGFIRGDRGLICLGNCIETIVSFWAIIKLGGVVSNIGVDTTADKLRYIIDDSEPSVLIGSSEKLLAVKGQLEQASYIKSILTVGEEMTLKNSIEYKNAQSYGENPVKISAVIDVDLASIIYTSGSTGAPKGVMLTHKNMVSALTSLNLYLEYQDRDSILCALPLSFDYGLYQMIMSISVGATLILEREFTWPIFLLKSLNKYQPTIFPVVPTLLMLMHEYMGRKDITETCVRKVTNTGAALNQNHISMTKQLFPDSDIFSMYGLTECKRCTYLPPEDIDRKPGSVGIAIPNTELWLVDDNNKRLTKANEVGQLVIRGSTVMAGYWRNPEKTQEKLKSSLFPGESLLYTGDYCRLDEEGYLYYEGRMDHVIKSGGIKVSPSEVEVFLNSVEGVESAAVIGVADDKRGEVLAAFVTLGKTSNISEETIMKYCHDSLESFKIPQFLTVMSSLPKTANGKFDLLKLRSHIQINESSDAA